MCMIPGRPLNYINIYIIIITNQKRKYIWQKKGLEPVPG